VTVTADERRHSNKRVTQALVALIIVGALISFNIWYTANQIRESDRRWCELIPSLDDRYQRLKTADPEAIKFRDQVHRIRSGLPC
jgi:hypothetical protein